MTTEATDPAQPTRLFMVRHGESQANLEERFTHHDDEPLTPLGVEQAEARGQALMCHCRPTAMYASPFHRAVHTAEEVGRPFSLKPALRDDLREQSFGEFQGRSYVDFAPLVQDVSPLGRWDLSAPGGESLREVAERAGRVIDEIVAQHAGTDVLVVSHGGVMAALRGWARGSFEHPPESTENANGYVLVRQSSVFLVVPFDEL